MSQVLDEELDYSQERKGRIFGKSIAFVAEEAQYLAELLGLKDVSTVTAGTPNLKGNLKPENIRRIFAENDPLEVLHDLAETVDFKNEDTEYDAVPEGHFFAQYLESESVRRAIFERRQRRGGRRRQQPSNNDGNDGSRINPPQAPNDDLIRDVVATLGDAIASAMEAEDNPQARAEAARDVIIEALGEFDRNSRESRDAKFRVCTGQVNEISNIQIFDREQINRIYQLLQQRLDGFFNGLLRFLAGNIDRTLRDYRRSVLNSRGTRKVYDRAQEILQENRPRSGARVTQDHNRFFAVTGGYAGARGLSGDRIARNLRGQLDDSAYVIHVPNRNSDLSETPDSLQSISRPNLRGYSPDAIEIAAQALAAHLQNPNIEINILGESGGGYLAEEAVYLLEQLGVPNVSGMGVGNPNFIGGVQAQNFTRILSPEEHLGREVHDFWARYHLADVSDPNQNIRRVQGHPFEYYLNTPQLQDFLHGQIGKTSKGRAKTINQVSRFLLVI